MFKVLYGNPLGYISSQLYATFLYHLLNITCGYSDLVYITEVRSSYVVVFITGIINFYLSFRQILEQSSKTSHRPFLKKAAP